MARIARIGKAFFIRNGVWYPLAAASSRVWRWSNDASVSSKIRGPKVCTSRTIAEKNKKNKK
jgi:hypothetical protein